MSDDLDDLSMRLRDELRGTQSGHDPWFGVRVMRTFEQHGEEDDQPPHPEAGSDDGRPR
ncbi:hypothetical protein [Sinomonas humi]|uniref:hypothetical protein n=1 Tax=Sinomonas humi TaxID=1338436 RepID=UPI0012E0B93B|nr:hypothetical protein [Sinomonas humi]